MEGQPVHPLWDKGGRCPLHSLLPVIPFPTSSSPQGEAGVDLNLSVSTPALWYLGFPSFCCFAWAMADKEAAAGAVGGLRCAD